jgi:hypothetical protein
LGAVWPLNADENQATGHLQGFEDGGFKAARIELRAAIRRRLAWDRFEDDAVDDGFDRMVLALVEAHALGQLGHLAVDARAEALLVEDLQLLAELALAPAHQRREDGNALAGGLRHDALDNLVGGLAGDGQAAVRAVRLADGGVEQAKVVVDLSDRADGGARAARGGLLLDGDGGREAVNRVHIRALHLI